MSWLLTAGVPSLISYSMYLGLWDWGVWFLGGLVGAVMAPYQAHVLSVLYYRLVDPQRPAVDPRVLAWPSVWTGPTPETA